MKNKTNQNKTKAVKETCSRWMQFIFSKASWKKKICQNLNLDFFYFFFFPERGGFPTHNMYYCLENWEAKNQNLEWRVGQEYFRVRVTSVPQQCSRTNSSCAYTFPFLGYAGAHYISQNAPLAIQSFMSFLSRFPLQDETLWEI